jgi:hypothetical protein
MSRHPLNVAVLAVAVGALQCGLTSPEPARTDASRDAGRAVSRDSGHDGSCPDGATGVDAHADAPVYTHHDAAPPPLDTGSDASFDTGGDAYSTDCLSNSWGSCTFMSACDGCCVDGTCLPKGASCGEGLGMCMGPSCSGVGAPGEPCLTGQVFVGVGITSNDPNLQCFYEPWTGCTTTNTTCGDAGVCVPCGVAGTPCCEFIQIFCVDGTYCKDQQMCDSECGKAGEPCCYGDKAVACADGGVCMTSAASSPTCVPARSCEADGGVCGSCGNIGQACCGDGGCDQGLCASGMCDQPPPHP